MKESVILLLVILLTAIVLPVSAEKVVPVHMEGIITNELYPELAGADYFSIEEGTPIEESLVNDGSTAESLAYVTDSQIAETFKEKMKGHYTGWIHFSWKGNISKLTKQKSFSKWITSLVKKASEHTGRPDEGDYIRWSWTAVSLDVDGWRRGNIFWGDIYFSFDYSSTAAQENTVGSWVDSKKSELELSGKSDYEKIWAIYKDLTEYITYGNPFADYTHSAYAATQGDAVCQGIALLFYRMALTAGVDCRIVTSVDHAWNLVKLGSKWYNLDATWDLSENFPNYNSDNPQWRYFLKNMKDFNDLHHKREKDYKSWTKTYPVDSNSYIPVESVSLSCPNLASTKSGKCTVTTVPAEALAGKKLTWSVESVSPETSWKYVTLKNGKITVKKGLPVNTNVTIKVSIDDGNGKFAESTPILKPISSGVILTNNDGDLGKTIVFDLGQNDSLVLGARTNPTDASNAVNWKISKNKLFAGSGSEAGFVVTPQTSPAKAGSVTVTAKAADGSEKTKSIKVIARYSVHGINVDGVEYLKGKIRLTPSFEPANATNKKVTWKSLTTGVTVSKAGVVTVGKKCTEPEATVRVCSVEDKSICKDVTFATTKPLETTSLDQQEEIMEVIPDEEATMVVGFGEETLQMVIGESMVPEVLNGEGLEYVIVSEGEAVSVDGDTITAVAAGEETIDLIAVESGDLLDSCLVVITEVEEFGEPVEEVIPGEESVEDETPVEETPIEEQVPEEKPGGDETPVEENPTEEPVEEPIGETVLEADPESETVVTDEADDGFEEIPVIELEEDPEIFEDLGFSEEFEEVFVLTE